MVPYQEEIYLWFYCFQTLKGLIQNEIKTRRRVKSCQELVVYSVFHPP